MASAALLALLIAGCAPSQTDAKQMAANQLDGKTLYMTYCVSCHGANGGNDRSGATPKMRLAAANDLAEDRWNQLVESGRGQMPAFQNRLSGAQISALHTYVRHLTSVSLK